MRRAWEDRGDNQPRDVARWYAGGCADIARRRFPDDDRTGRVAGLLERVVDGADPPASRCSPPARHRRTTRWTPPSAELVGLVRGLLVPDRA